MPIYIPSILLAIPRNPATAVGLPIVAGFLSGAPTSNVANSNWYHDLKTPPGRPPREVFPYVWTLLYASMGYASHLAVKALDSTPFEGNRQAYAFPTALTISHSCTNRNALSLGIALYYAQLGLNCLWSPIFFAGRKPGLALVDSVLLTATTMWMTKVLDRPTNAKATYYLLPYCGWLVFATYLNGGVWWLNRSKNERGLDKFE